jgi:trans-aconitate methyltransferase
MADFATRDPLQPGFWDERFARGFTPWDAGGVPQALRDFVARSQPMRTLIPGCGTAYELVHLSEQGWPATAIDFSPEAVASARKFAPQWRDRIVEADFFKYAPEAPLDLIYERAFLCALPRAMWLKVAARWAQLLAPDKLLAGFFFFDDAAKGPPFGIARAQLDDLMAPYFSLVAEEAVRDSVPVFEGKERWLLWQRRSK